MNKKLFQVTGYYKNDKTHGLGFTVVTDDSTLNAEIEDYIEKYEEDWKSLNEEEQKETVNTYFSQLEHFSKLRAEGREMEIKPQEKMVCIMNIWFLENHGFLKPDEYNGCIFLYEGEKG